MKVFDARADILYVKTYASCCRQFLPVYLNDYQINKIKLIKKKSSFKKKITKNEYMHYQVEFSLFRYCRTSIQTNFMQLTPLNCYNF